MEDGVLDNGVVLMDIVSMALFLKHDWNEVAYKTENQREGAIGMLRYQPVE